MKRKSFTLIALTTIVTSLIFGGCSGGGGGGNGGGAGGGGPYNGVTSQALIDEDNAQEMIAGAFEAANSGMAPTELPASIQQPPSDYKTVHGFQALKLPIALRNAVVSTEVTNLSGRFFTSAVETESGTIEGDCGGKASYNFEINDVAGTFDGSMTFLSFCDDGVTISGRTNVYGTFDTDTDELLTFTINFDNLESDYIILDGEISVDLTMIPYVVTMNYYGTDKVSNKVYWIRYYTLTVTEFNYSTEVELTGRFYHPDYGYVNLTTRDLFVIYDGDDFPSDGALVLSGADGTKAELIAIDYLYCECKSDSDGDGAWDWESGAMLWSDLHETDGEGDRIEWITEGFQTSITYHYSGGVLSGMTFHRKFEVTSGSGNVQIKATLKDKPSSTDVIDEIADTFHVLENIEYEVLVYANVGGQGLCSPFDTDKMIFSSPSASKTSEITIMPELKKNPATGQDDYYCVKNYTIDSITLN